MSLVILQHSFGALINKKVCGHGDPREFVQKEVKLFQARDRSESCSEFDAPKLKHKSISADAGRAAAARTDQGNAVGMFQAYVFLGHCLCV